MLMWIASVFVSLFHLNAKPAANPVQLDKPVATQGVPAHQSILDLIVQLLSDGTHYP